MARTPPRSNLGQVTQHLIAVLVPILVIQVFEVVNIDDCQREGRAVTLQYFDLRIQHVVHCSAIAESGQRIGPHLGERHQVVALIANPFLGVGDFAHELKGRIKYALDFSAQFLPDDISLLSAQFCDPVLEPLEAGVVLGRAVANRAKSLFPAR